jgi:hypothetical protein
VGRRSGAKFNIEYKRLFGAAHGNDHVAQEKVADVLGPVMGVIGTDRTFPQDLGESHRS